MEKIKKILVGTNNIGKYKEICALLPKGITKHSLNEFKIEEPEETGKSFEDNSLIKASYYSKKTNLICLSDDSGLEIKLLNGSPGIYSSRWAGDKKDFNLAMDKIFKEMKKIRKDWENENIARFVCCLTLFWPNGKSYSARGEVNGKITPKKKGNYGFGYDPIFIPDGYDKTFSEMENKYKMNIDHRYKAYLKINHFFN